MSGHDPWAKWSLPLPDFDLPPLAPFIRLRERIDEATLLSDENRGWLLTQLSGLEVRYTALPPGKPWCAIHGDARTGNVVVTGHGPVLLDLERFAHGPPEWDLSSIAVNYTTFGNYPAEVWNDFCQRYGDDVTTWDGFAILRDARELRKVTFAVQMAPHREDIAEQARYRLACLRGEHGPRPWGWTGVRRTTRRGKQLLSHHRPGAMARSTAVSASGTWSMPGTGLPSASWILQPPRLITGRSHP